MKISRASSYALHAIVYMASQKKDCPLASHLIAQACGIPERFLLKVLKPLVSARVLHSTKGPHGGYRLARGPNEITLLEVLEEIDGPIRGDAPPGRITDGNPLSLRLNQVCSAAAELTRKALRKVKISELAAKD